MFGKKPNYEAVFASPEETRQLIYGDKSKTADVLGNQDFINAWLSSRNMPQISALIRSEALKGDVPSIKQMIWLADIYYGNSKNIPDAQQRIAIQKSALSERILFCEKAIGLGMAEKSYPAMISCANLYSLLESGGASVTDSATREALNGAVRNASLFLSSGYADPDLIQDAKDVLAQFAPLAKIMNAFNSGAQSR